MYPMGEQTFQIHAFYVTQSPPGMNPMRELRYICFFRTSVHRARDLTYPAMYKARHRTQIYT